MFRGEVAPSVERLFLGSVIWIGVIYLLATAPTDHFVPLLGFCGPLIGAVTTYFFSQSGASGKVTFPSDKVTPVQPVAPPIMFRPGLGPTARPAPASPSQPTAPGPFPEPPSFGEPSEGSSPSSVSY